MPSLRWPQSCRRFIGRASAAGTARLFAQISRPSLLGFDARHRHDSSEALYPFNLVPHYAPVDQSKQKGASYDDHLGFDKEYDPVSTPGPGNDDSQVPFTWANWKSQQPTIPRFRPRVIDQTHQLRAMFFEIRNDMKKQYPQIFLDVGVMEGLPHEQVSFIGVRVYDGRPYIVDVATLKKMAFSYTDSYGSSLRAILESRETPKSIYNVARGCTVLHSQYGICLKNVVEMQTLGKMGHRASTTKTRTWTMLDGFVNAVPTPRSTQEKKITKALKAKEVLEASGRLGDRPMSAKLRASIAWRLTMMPFLYKLAVERLEHPEWFAGMQKKPPKPEWLSELQDRTRALIAKSEAKSVVIQQQAQGSIAKFSASFNANGWKLERTQDADQGTNNQAGGHEHTDYRRVYSQ